METIIAILIAVLADRYAQHLPGAQVIMRLRSTAWLNSYLAKCISMLEKLGIKQSYLIVLSAILPLCIVLLLLKLLFGFLLGSVGSTLFIALTLFYFLGNRAADQQSTQYVVAHETSFGVLFWFAIFEYAGAFIYWFLVVGKQTPIMQDPLNNNIQLALTRLHALAAWIPARVTGFIYALMGNFTPGFQCWTNCMRNPKQPSSQVLQDCGQASVDSSIAGDDARLVVRAFVAWVVLIIILVYLKGY